jgi:hypothetical protein
VSPGRPTASKEGRIEPQPFTTSVGRTARNRTEVHRHGSRTIVVSDRSHGDDLETELVFFLKAWALSHPAVQFELYRR